jgi:hypothetical protein
VVMNMNSFENFMLSRDEGRVKSSSILSLYVVEMDTFMGSIWTIKFPAIFAFYGSRHFEM